MPDVPRDPRQLARDILSGKVRIEDLARERQLRGGGGGAPRPRPPERVPLPRPVQPAPRQPVQRAPVRQPPRPVPPPLQRSQRPISFPQRQPQYTVPAPAPAPPPPRQPEPPPAEALSGAKAPRRSFRLNELVRSRHALRQGILLAEVLGKPVSLREE